MTAGCHCWLVVQSPQASNDRRALPSQDDVRSGRSGSGGGGGGKQSSAAEDQGQEALAQRIEECIQEANESGKDASELAALFTHAPQHQVRT